jgi:antimicrobial peptide system SdpB family protein
MFFAMNDLISQLETKRVFINRIAFVRLLLALNALLLLLFTDITRAADYSLLDVQGVQDSLFKPLSVFAIFGDIQGKWISIFILLFVVTGYFPRISIFLQVWVHLSICNSLIIIEGGDQIASNLSILLIPFCVFDPRNNQWSQAPVGFLNKNANIFLNIYSFLVRLQVAIIYLHAATGKVVQADWLDGTCLYYWTTNNVFGTSIPLQRIFNYLTLSDFAPVLSWSVIFFELGLFACILATQKNVRRFFLFSGILFHFSILVTHGLVEFFFSMCAALILYLDWENQIQTRLSNLFHLSKGFLKSKIGIIKIKSHGN